MLQNLAAMNRSESQSLLSSLNQVKVFDLQMVDGYCIIPYHIFFMTPSDDNTYVKAVAFPGTEREHAILIDKAELTGQWLRRQIKTAVWIDIELGRPTDRSISLGAGIEMYCRQRQAQY
jgi:hypothetical protein